MRAMTWGFAMLLIVGATARAQTMVDLTASQGVANAAGATSGTSASTIINDVRSHVPSSKAGWTEPSDGGGANAKTAWVRAGGLSSHASGSGRGSWLTRASASGHASNGGSAWVHAGDPSALHRH